MQKAFELILHKVPFISRRLDVHMLEVVSGTAVALFLKVIGGGLTFCFHLLLARTLGAEGAGLFFLALTVATIATVFGRMGLDNTLLRVTAASAAVGDWRVVKGVYRKGIALGLFSSAMAALTMFVAAPFLSKVIFHKPELVGPMRWMVLAVAPLSFMFLHAEMLKGLKRIRDSILIYGVVIPAFSLLGLHILGGVHGVNGAVWVYVIAAALAALLGLGLWRSAVPQLLNTKGHFETRELFRSSMPLFWVALLNMLITWAATFALGVWGTKEDVGIFSMASRTAMLTSLVLMAVNSIAAPKFAVLYRKREIDTLGSTARGTAKLMTFMASPILLLFLFAPEWVMGIFGEEFTGGAAALSILAVGQFVNVATGSVGYLLMMSENERLVRNNMVFAAVMSVILNAVLVPFAGVLGAAIATAVSLSSMNLVAVYLVWYRLRIWTIPWIGIFYMRNKA